MPQMRHIDVPCGAIGMLHTHPQGPLPSGNDQQVARLAQIYSYVVSPTHIYAMGPNGAVLWVYTR